MHAKNKYLTEITSVLRAGAEGDKKAKYADLKKYIGTNYDFIGLSSPRQRALFKTGYSFSHLPVNEQLKIWDGLWQQSDLYEVLSQCLYFVEKYIKKLDPEELWNITQHWVRKIDNWAHSDTLSSTYAYLMEQFPDVIYAQYKIWNTSANPWERRQSVVGMLLYSKARTKFLTVNKMLKLVAPLLLDEDYFVQKGVGWALREIGNVYPEDTMKFLQKHCGIITPVAFTSAIEKIGAKEKGELKQLRKTEKAKK